MYVRQTGERDIQERLADLLQDAGLRVEILRPTVAPDKRFDWLKKRATIDVACYSTLLTRAFDTILQPFSLAIPSINPALFLITSHPAYPSP